MSGLKFRKCRDHFSFFQLIDKLSSLHPYPFFTASGNPSAPKQIVYKNSPNGNLNLTNSKIMLPVEKKISMRWA